MKGIVLIIDGNHQLMKTVFPLQNTNRLYGELYNVLKNSFERLIKIYPFQQVFHVSDSKNSWRKQINSTYKENRKKTEDVDWEFVFQCYTEFKQDVSKKHSQVEYNGLEGDDWIAEIVKQSNRKGYSCLIVSADQDLLQLLEWNDQYINIMFRDTLLQEKVWFPNGYEVFLHQLKKVEMDLFALDNRYDFFDLIKRLRKYQTFEVNPNQILFCKVVAGDAGDNVASTLITKTKTGKPRGIGESGANKIWNNYVTLLGENVDYQNNETLDTITDLVLEYKKVDDSYRQQVMSKINENVKLIQLNNSSMPVEYQTVLSDMVEKEIKMK